MSFYYILLFWSDCFLFIFLSINFYYFIFLNNIRLEDEVKYMMTSSANQHYERIAKRPLNTESFPVFLDVLQDEIIFEAEVIFLRKFLSNTFFSSFISLISGNSMKILLLY